MCFIVGGAFHAPIVPLKNVKETTLATPVGGWNAYAPFANMHELDAVITDNYFSIHAYARGRVLNLDQSYTASINERTLDE